MVSEHARDLDALVAFIDARMRTGFAWGKRANDCAAFAGAAARVQTGGDPLRALPDWTTKRGALRALRRVGGLAAGCNLVLTPVTLAHAARGDIALVENDDGPALMVIEGETLVGPGPGGLVRRPRSAMVQAWSIL